MRIVMDKVARARLIDNLQVHRDCQSDQHRIAKTNPVVPIGVRRTSKPGPWQRTESIAIRTSAAEFRRKGRQMKLFTINETLATNAYEQSKQT